MDKFSAKLESAYASSGGKKINIITHSMGGLLVKCFMSLHSDVSELFPLSYCEMLYVPSFMEHAFAVDLHQSF